MIQVVTPQILVQDDVVSKVSIYIYHLHRDWCDILSRSTIGVVLS